MIVVDAPQGQISSGRSRAFVTSVVAYYVVAALAQVFAPVELVAQRLTWPEPFGETDYEHKLAAAVAQVRRYAGADVMEVVGVMGQDMIVVVGQSLSLEELIVGFDEDLGVQNSTEVVAESHNHQRGSYMVVLKQETVASYNLGLLDMDKVLEGGPVVEVQEPFAAVLTHTGSALELW